MKSIALRPWELAAYMREKKLLVVRTVKPQPVRIQEGHEKFLLWFDKDMRSREGGKSCVWCNTLAHLYCPFGKPGEVLGIKESGQWEAAEFDHTLCGTAPVIPANIRYAADGCPKPWKPAQQMPEWAIRHRPIIADIRVMRVGEIADDEAITAGAQCPGMPASLTNRGAFGKRWEADHGKGSWASNPWCWFMNVVEK